MLEFVSLLKVVFTCGTVAFVTMMILLALPQCKLRYVGLEICKWSVVAGLLFLTFSPLDLLPGLPLDDIFYLIGAYATGKSAFKDRGWRKLLEEEEMVEFAMRKDAVSGRKNAAEAMISESYQE